MVATPDGRADPDILSSLVSVRSSKRSQIPALSGFAVLCGQCRAVPALLAAIVLWMATSVPVTTVTELRLGLAALAEYKK